MPLVEIPIAEGFYVNRVLPLSAQECTNFYAKASEQAGLSKAVVLGTPGIRGVATSGQILQANRGSYVVDGVPYYVNGSGLYRLDRDIADAVEEFALVFVGAVEGSKRVSMASNGRYLVFLEPGGAAYAYDTVLETLSEISDLDFRANGDPQHVIFADGYFLFTTDTKKYILSNLNDPLTYNALDFGSAESDPDPIVAPLHFRGQLFLAGSQTIEVLQNTPPAPSFGSPFQRVGGGEIPYGVFAPFSLISTGDRFFFIGGSLNDRPTVRSFGGGGAIEKVSTDAIDALLEKETPEGLLNIFSWYYSEAGAMFVGFSLTDTTVVFDVLSGRWHERKSRIDRQEGSVTTRWRANSVVSAYAKTFVSDSEDGRVGILSLDSFDEYGNPIRRVVSTLPITNGAAPSFIAGIELTLETGVSSETAEPVVYMDVTNDGKTWTDSRPRKLGMLGQYNKIVSWRGLPWSRRFFGLRFTFTDKSKAVILKLEADIRGG